MRPVTRYEPFFRRLTAGPTRYLLWPFGKIWALAAAIRRWAYSSGGPLKPKKLPVPVISVGNIAVGGTGKSPFVIYLAGLLGTTGRRVAVLSRGYGRSSVGTMVVSVPGEGPVVEGADAGDEPLMLARALRDAGVVVGSDRYSAGLAAVQDFGAEILVLDDGFQHIQLARDLDVVLLDVGRPPEMPFPAGLAREGADALFFADVIVYSKANVAGYNERWEELVARYAKKSVKVETEHRPTGVREPDDERPLGLGEVTGRRVLAMAGIGDFNAFVGTLNEVGAVVAVRRAFPDHYKYTKSDLLAVERSAFAAGCAAIVTTAKDEARISGWKTRMPVYILDVKTVVTAGEPELEAVLFKKLSKYFK